MPPIRGFGSQDWISNALTSFHRETEEKAKAKAKVKTEVAAANPSEPTNRLMRSTKGKLKFQPTYLQDRNGK